MWKTWDDYYMLIEPHDDEDEGAEEGLEAFGAAPDYEEDSQNEDLDEDDEEDQPGGDGKGAAGDEGDGSQPSSDDDDDDDDDDADHSHDGAGVEDASIAKSTAVASGSKLGTGEVALAPQPSDSQPSNEIERATKLLYERAVLEKTIPP